MENASGFGEDRPSWGNPEIEARQLRVRESLNTAIVKDSDHMPH